MASNLATGQDGVADAELKALVATMTDPQRAGIVRVLFTRPGLGSTEIADWLDLPAAVVRKQLRALMETGMVQVKERSARRGVEKLYFVASRRTWITEEHEARLSLRQHQTTSLETLRLIVRDAHRAIATRDFGARTGRIMASVPATVDARAWREISDLQHELLARIVDIAEAGNQRLVESEEEPVSLVAALLLLELPDPFDRD
jgi:predicted ArsR family transcriptional regulator